MKRVGFIGCGAIAMPVIRAALEGKAGAWAIVGVLARRARDEAGIRVSDDAQAFYAARPDLIVEAAGPQALCQHGAKSLAAADLWSVSGTALVDDAFRAELEQIGAAAGHRLRLVAGAIAGLDGIAAAAIDPAARVTVDAESDAAPETFRGTAREAARRFPNDVNTGVAAAFAGSGLDTTTIEVRPRAAAAQRLLSLEADSAYGRLAVRIEPRVLASSMIHPVAASLIANLRREGQVIWAG